MKRTLTLLLALALLPLLTACPGPPEPPGDPTAETTTEPVAVPGLKLPGFAEFTANWAWGAANGSGEAPAATHLAVIGYPEDCDFGKLDLAVGPFGQAKVKYAGEKKGDDSIEPWYFASYERVTGPYFAFEQPAAVTGWEPVFLMDSSTLGDGLIALESKYDSEDYAYPPASAADIAEAGTLHPGRRIEESQLLAVAEDGARVCMFRYENLAQEGLFAIVCFDGGKALAIDYTTNNVDEDGAGWRVDLEPDEVGLLEPVLLCRTQEGILLFVAWSAPEGMGQLTLREKDGALKAFDLGGYDYDPWGDKFYLYEYEEDEG